MVEEVPCSILGAARSMMRVAVILAIVALTCGPEFAVAQVVTPTLEPAMPAPSRTTGAAVVYASPRQCENATSFTLTRVSRLPSGGTSRDGRAYNDVTFCRWIIESLDPAEYEVHLTTPTGSGGHAAFTVLAGHVLSVKIQNPTVHVSGRVLLHGRPVADATLRFLTEPLGGMASVTTNSAGRYEVMLDSPGEYDLGLVGLSLASQSKSVAFNRGRNLLDWNITGGALTVRVMGDWDHSSNVVVRLVGQRSTWADRLEPGQEPIVVVRGIPFGTYDIAALQLPRHTSRKTLPVILSPENPEADITVEIGESRSRLIISDEHGGVYSLEGHTPGTPIRMRFGSTLTPACYEVPFDSTLYVTARKGRRVEVRTAQPNTAIIPDWTIVGVNDSDCPVLLRDFVYAAISGPPGQPPRFMFENFPLTNSLLLRIGGRQYEVAVSDGVLVLPF
jgi:hypothetical protein